MRHCIFLFVLCLLLAGCAQPQPEPAAETTLPSAPQPTAATTAATEPPDPLQLILQGMTTEEKVGQLFLARCPAENAISDIQDYHLGGYILFGRDFQKETPDSLRQTLQAYQDAASLPMLMAVDEEGGSVCRVSSNPVFRASRFPSPREAYAQGGLEQVLSVETEKARLLHSLGINVNMGPVCDITTDAGAFMYPRSLGEGPRETGRFAASAVQIMKQQKVGSVLKHFPGYGNTADTHTGMATDQRTLEELEQQALIPFSSGIQAGCDAILISHTIVSAFDPELPASLDPSIHRYLRETMGFEGVIITDDLVMQAITDSFGTEEAAVLAVLAGNDLLCSTEYPLQYPAVLQAVQEGRISMEQLNAAVMRILRWKQALGLICE